MKRLVFCGDDIVEIDIPEDTRSLRAPGPAQPLADYENAVARAIREPLGTLPLGELVKPSSTVTIAFDDPCLPLPPMGRDVRGSAIGVILRELYSAGVDRDNISLICANGLHRKWKPGELRHLLGRNVFSEMGTGRIRNHDAEDPLGMVDLGVSAGGHPVRVNKAVTSCDLLVYVNVNWTSMNGGWKSILVGLGDYRGIRPHHNVEVLTNGGTVMDPGSRFHEILRDMGKVVDENARVFTVETVLNNREWGPVMGGLLSLEAANRRLPLRLLARMPQSVKSAFSGLMRSAFQPIAVNAGAVEPVHAATLAALYLQQDVKVEGQTDAILVGVPNISPYSVFSRINPVLAANTTLGYILNMHRGEPPVKKDGVLIVLQPFLPGFNRAHHPSYVEFFERVITETLDPAEMAAEFEEDFATRREYVDAYRFGYAYHGVHPFYVWYWCAPARKHLGRIIVVGAVDPSIPARLGFENAATVEEALKSAGESLGVEFSLTHLVIPPVFLTDAS